MSIFNKFKKMTGPERKPKTASKSAVKEKKAEAVEEAAVRPARLPARQEKRTEAAPTEAKAKISDTAWRILKYPRVSEKSALLAEANQYVFNVFPKANKIEIKQAVEKLYNVTVKQVRVVNIPPKKRRLGRTEGFRKGLKTGYRKAIVALKKGQTIDIMPH